MSFKLLSNRLVSSEDPSLERAILRLFNAVRVTDKTTHSVPEAIMERVIRNGYILDPTIQPDDELLDIIESVIGISGEKANAAFHKSWKVVQESSMLSLVVQQICHYITTYGYKELGVYSEDTVYIPSEVLQLPEIEGNLPLTVVKAMDAQEILEDIIKLGSGVALAQETLGDIMVVVRSNSYDNSLVEKIGNRELKALLCDYYDIVPAEPVVFLRHLIAKLTGESLLIKNDALIEKIKEADGALLDRLIAKAPEDLASIFLRFKPIFLAMKSISGNKTFFNRLRKKAVELHKPLPPDYLNSITSQLKQGVLDTDCLTQRLENASIFRKTRLAYALNHRLHSDDSTVYRVRNGRGWVTDFDWPAGLRENTQKVLDMVLNSIASELRQSIEGMKIYIPPHVHYALPATEKQFTGNWPTGSYISAPQHMIVGIHWTNTGRHIDLDLSVIGESGKIGWDADYRSNESGILFSGDITDAPLPKGATELFYFKNALHEPKIMMVNYYNFEQGDDVDCKILVAHEKPENFESNYMIDVKNIIGSANIKIRRRQDVLGLVVKINGENRIYFANVSIGSSITSYTSSHAARARKYLFSSMVNSLDVAHILTMSGATLVQKRPADGKYYDLSPEALTKTSFLDLLKPSR